MVQTIGKVSCAVDLLLTSLCPHFITVLLSIPAATTVVVGNFEKRMSNFLPCPRISWWRMGYDLTTVAAPAHMCGMLLRRQGADDRGIGLVGRTVEVLEGYDE